MVWVQLMYYNDRQSDARFPMLFKLMSVVYPFIFFYNEIAILIEVTLTMAISGAFISHCQTFSLKIKQPVQFRYTFDSVRLIHTCIYRSDHSYILTCFSPLGPCWVISSPRPVSTSWSPAGQSAPQTPSPCCNSSGCEQVGACWGLGRLVEV